MLTRRGLALVLCLALPLAAQDSPRAGDASSEVDLRVALAREIEAYLQAHHAIDQLSGAVLVADRGELVYRGGFGMANSDWLVPNEPETKFRLASVTKQFTAMAVLLLVEEGVLDLDAPITTWLRDYPKASGERVTLHHLLNHTSGIPSYTDRPDFMRKDAKQRFGVDAFVATYCSEPLEFEPGSRFQYNNSGYFLLGAILEQVTGKTFAEVLEERIFGPLGMHDSGVDDQYRVIPGRAVGYDDILGGRRVAMWIDMTTPGAAGAVYSTVEDLWLWDQALREGTLLDKELAERMVTPGLGDYAYGWEVSEQPPDSGGSRLDTEDASAATPRIAYSHGGGMPGVSTMIWRVPAEGRCIVVLGNTMQTNAFAIRRGIEHILAGRDPGPVRPRGDFEVARTVLAEGHAPALARLRTWPENVQEEYLLPDLAGLSRALLEQERDADARKLTAFLLEAYPVAPLAWDASAYVHRQTGDLATAIAHYGRLLELDPDAHGIAELVDELVAEAGR